LLGYEKRGEITANIFDEMGDYWAEIADQNQTERQIQFLKNQLKPEGYFLDLACGTGRHSISLTAEGYSMVGLDISRRLLRIAKQRFREVQVVLGDMRFLPFKTGTFEAVVSMDTSFGYLPSENDDRDSLAEVQRILFRQGIFVIDVFNRGNLTLKYRGKTYSSIWKEYCSFFLMQKRKVSDDGGWLFDSWTIRDKSGGKDKFFEHKVRLYRQPELQGLLEKVGFAVEKVFGGYESEKFSAESPRLIIIANIK
jgi:ubiquinone/menaquinone biosynthesis C-methylase UbiE